jgi:predicted phosphodiesterase
MVYTPVYMKIWDFRDREKLETFWVSDVHLGHKCCDEELFKANVERIRKKNMPFADLGDLIENSTRDSVGAGVYEQEEIAQEQLERAVEIYRPVSHLLQVMYKGNHEGRSFKSGGLDLTRIMAKMLEVNNGGIGGYNLIKVGNQIYSVYASHGGTGAWTVGGKFNALLRMGNTLDADVVICGHGHDTVYHSREVLYPTTDGKVKKRRQHLVMNGAYLNWMNSYAQEKGYPIPNKGNAQITFNGTKKEVEVSFV